MEKINLELQKALTNYINEKHTQEECNGFIEGFKIAQALFELSEVNRTFKGKYTQEFKDYVFKNFKKTGNTIYSKLNGKAYSLKEIESEYKQMKNLKP